MQNLDGKSMNIIEQNIEKLKEIFPEVFSEGKIDFSKLEEELGSFKENENERYNFTWNGKSEAKKIALTPSTGTLRPCKEESKDWDKTQNLYIEGDNLEVLKLLQKSYHKKVKMIYIDPPYNTGKDFVYKDNFRDNIKNYLEITGQVDSDGNKLSTNSETSGRYHSDWLNMMYPRLKLARNLLKDDGVIFISIDDNEVANLRKLCDEIFGEDNFVGEIIRKTKSMTGDEGTGFNLQHENLIIYSKNKSKLILNGEEKVFDNYKNPDNDPKGDWTSGDPSAKSGSESTYFEIINPLTNKSDFPPKGRFWAFSKKSLAEYIQNGKIKFKDEYKGSERGFIFKRYKNELQSLFNPVNSLYSIENDYMNQVGTKEIKSIFEDEYFDNPKPILFIQKIVQYSVDKDDIILDFFSGSATTAHAVMKLNSEDDGNRKFICVQLPEITDEKSESFKAGYKNICEIGKERIRRAGEKVKTESGKTELDIGFKVLKLDSSNIKSWDSDFENLETNLLDSVENIKSDRNEEDLLYEILLKYGLDLTLPIEELNINGKKIFSIGFGSLVCCLDNDIDTNIVEKIAELKKQFETDFGLENMRVVFKDSSFKDSVVKTNALQILKQNGINEVVSV
ncbi:site-specific DNA-methyltransferase [Aliarcobacter butzleri]|uniref:site-specific DNA-methyltransferase n=1 Tax=Aliarcobacter butzleri TaxID=28197 RepID=UPI0024DE4D02|nr:site-specific DNA-methyltransferase [Aliarcobacter butzleri]MDK2082904.1 site-specific DNA-methyltransferase [Aliarcobacter butzleri]